MIQRDWRTNANIAVAINYARGIVDGSITANRERIQACKRFLDDLENPKYEIRTKDCDFVIGIIEKTFRHNQGQDIQGNSLKGKLLKLEPWQRFVVVNLLAFYIRGTIERRFKEAFIFIPRKNGKTLFISALAFALSLLERENGSKCYIIGSALRQAKQSFDGIKFSIKEMGELDNFRVLDNNAEHSLERHFEDDNGREIASIFIEALPANPDKHDSLNSNVQICDELHAYKNAKQYNVIREAGKAYTNKLCVGITTAGDNMASFCYQRLKYCQRVLNGTGGEAESLFIFICKADEDEKGNVDYLNPIQHEKANPNYGVSIRPGDIMKDATEAANDPQQRKDFLAKSLNVYTSALRAYFNLDEFRASDKKYNWTLPELAKLPVDWYGGADLSRLHDLTAAALVGNYKGVDIIITHAFFPIVNAYKKADEDNIPLFEWKDKGWLTMCNTPTVNHDDVVRWFMGMRDMGFKIKQVGHDPKFCRDYFIGMKKARFKVVPQLQLYVKKSEGFRRIEYSAKNGLLYYCHSGAYEYCVENVHAIEKTDDMVQYEKVVPEMRIDLFDASVFGTVRRLEDLEKLGRTENYFSN